MRITRTANAGVLLQIDGVSILLDGICGEVPPYLPTPEPIRQELYATLPDAVAFTHTHIDHYDREFALFFQKNAGKEIVSPQNKREIQVGSVNISSVDSRHIGRNDIAHISVVLTGSRCVWFMGDASPVALKGMDRYPKPDVLFVPFAYLNGKAACEATKSVGAAEIVLLHLPSEERDDYKIWDTVHDFITNEQHIHVLGMGETLDLY